MNKTKPNTPFIEEIVKDFREKFSHLIPSEKQYKNRETGILAYNDFETVEAFLILSLEAAEEEGFKKGFDDCKGLVERGEHAQCCIIPGSLKPSTQEAEKQIDKLATFIMNNIPGEPSESEGAVDTAIRLLNALQQSTEKGEK